MADSRPTLVEISKDMADAVSLKALSASLASLKDSTGAELAYAGTTDLVACAGLPWSRYRLYLAVQFAQARFLDCSVFRFLLGDRVPGMTVDTLIDRVNDVCADLAPIEACFEVHGGIERDPEAMHQLLAATPLKVVIDLENMQRAGLDSDQLMAIVPAERIAYFHQRNLPDVWTEHEATLADEVRWHALLPDTPFLWEPKTIDDPARIRELFGEYRRSH